MRELNNNNICDPITAKYLAVEIKNLTKKFKDNKIAVNNVSFSVEKGEIFGFLGPNGAGKTTILKILTTILKPTSGTILIENIDVTKEPLKARMQFGYVSQEVSVDEMLTARENLYLQAKYYHLNKYINTKLENILKHVDLVDSADKVVSTYSGGMKKRIDIACALVNAPKILFLDEPTLGLDVQTRKEIWKYINVLNKEYEMTVFLTTHYLEEADSICDRIAIIDKGEVKIIDTPRKLKTSVGSGVGTTLDAVYLKYTGKNFRETSDD